MKYTQEELANLKKRAQTVARFEGHDDVVKIIDQDIANYEQNLQSGEESALKAAEARLTHNAQVVEEILSEHDYISMLLAGKGQATTEQLDVLLFPKTKDAKSNVLQVSGGAGTGKTLVLLSRIIQEIKQQDFATSKKALFICFNKSLADYITGLLRAHFGEVSKHVTVINIDALIKRIMDYKHQKKLGITYGASEIKGIIKEVSVMHRGENIGFLDTDDPKNVDWVKDEVDWIEGRKDIEFGGEYSRYQEFGRIGRGSMPYNPGRNSRARESILEILDKYNFRLAEGHKYTLAQAVNELLRDASQEGYTFDKSERAKMNEPRNPRELETAQYDIIAIDEVQDISIASILLLLTFRKPGAKVVLAGDEGQKLYKRDFKWKQLSDNSSNDFGKVIGHTVSLDRNYRNHVEIERFAAMLGDAQQDNMIGTSKAVELTKKSIAEVIEKVRLLKNAGGTTCVIVDTKESASSWKNLLENSGIKATTIYQRGNISTPGVYIANIHQVKGLEFDNVVMPNTEMAFDDEKVCRNLYYVAFTRARSFLGVYFQEEPNALIRRYYGELL